MFKKIYMKPLKLIAESLLMALAVVGIMVTLKAFIWITLAIFELLL